MPKRKKQYVISSDDDDDDADLDYYPSDDYSKLSKEDE